MICELAELWKDRVKVTTAMGEVKDYWATLKARSSGVSGLPEKTLYCVDFNQGRALGPKELSGS